MLHFPINTARTCKITHPDQNDERYILPTGFLKYATSHHSNSNSDSIVRK